MTEVAGGNPMKLQINGLSELRDRLQRLRLDEVMASALREQAERVAATVRDGLSEPVGAGEHGRPWLKSGALRDSIGVQSEGLSATVGSNDQAAIFQEIGTSRVPPRPFLAPVGASMRDSVAREIGEKVIAALKGESGATIEVEKLEPGIMQVSATGTDTGWALMGAGLLALGYLALRGATQDRGHPSVDPAAPQILLHSSNEDDLREGEKGLHQAQNQSTKRRGQGITQGIKAAIGAANDDDTRISPDGDVWSQHPDGSWTNYGSASNLTGSGRPSGRRGRDRR